MKLTITALLLLVLIGLTAAGLVKRQDKVPQSAPIECIFARDTSKVKCKSLTRTNIICDAALVGEPFEVIRFSMAQTSAYSNPQDAKFPLTPLRGTEVPGSSYGLFSAASTTTDLGVKVDSACWPGIVSFIVDGANPSQLGTPETSKKGNNFIGVVRVVQTEEGQS